MDQNLKEKVVSSFGSVCVRLLLLCALFCSPLNAQALKGEATVYPLLGTKLSSDFGTRKHPIRRIIKHHSGVDLAAPRHAQIRAVADGRVVFSDFYAGYGRLVVIMHSEGYTTHYGHCQSLSVAPGEIVKAGDIIATVGSSGNSTGPHLHFEVRREGKALNPFLYFPDLASFSEG